MPDHDEDEHIDEADVIDPAEFPDGDEIDSTTVDDPGAPA